MFLETIREEDATGKVADSYAADRARLGFVMSATACWTARPDLLPAWEAFYAQVKANFSLSPRDWRLITFIAAKQVPSTYCSMVYGKMLLDDLGSRDKVLAVQADFRSAGLGERDTAMLAYAETVARDASRITERDIDALRAVGLRDVQIADIALCAALLHGPVLRRHRRRARGRLHRPGRLRHRARRRAQTLVIQESPMPTSVKELLAAANAAVPRVTREEATALIHSGALVVDVRDAPELKAGKIAGAAHVSRGMLEFRADPESPYHDPAFRRDRTVILYCASGGRSALAGKALRDLGYTDVRNLGAFKDWAEGGGAVEAVPEKG
jgi:uncharacterized peroxidase-related enzyme